MSIDHGRPLAGLLVGLSVVLIGVAAGLLDRDRVRAVAEVRYGPQSLGAVNDWFRLIDLTRNQPVATQLDRVNQFFNSRTSFEDDIIVWKAADYWATPLETLVRGRGDCEDFTIAKYESLLALGVPEARLRLIYVRAVVDRGDARPVAHMVLGYYAHPDDEPQILDNLDGRIKSASLRFDLTPVFSFNREGLWAGDIKAPSDPTQRLSRWRELLARLRNEGFE